jgi:hypothetical protein
MRRSGDLEILMRSARRLAKLCQQGAAMVTESRESGSEAVSARCT